MVEDGIETAERDLYEEAATEFLSYFSSDSTLDIEIVETPQETASIETAPLQDEVFLRNQASSRDTRVRSPPIADIRQLVH